MTERLLNVAEMAKLSGLSVQYFYCGKCNKTLDLPLIKIGNRVRCKESDFNKWLESKRV